MLPKLYFSYFAYLHSSARFYNNCCRFLVVLGFFAILCCKILVSN